MPVDIPGYYFDTEKNKYFKIQGSGTAPAAASYSSDSVKRRRRNESKQKKLAREEALLVRNRNIRRAAAVWGDDLTRGLLERELGVRSSVAQDVGAAAWAAGAQYMGEAKVKGRPYEMSCFWVGVPDGMDVGVVVVPEHECLLAREIPTDCNGNIENAHRQPDSPQDQDDSFRIMVPGSESFMSICYTSSRNGLLATSGDPGRASKVHSIEPATQPAPSNWIFDTERRITPTNWPERDLRYFTTCATPSTPGPVLGLLGTDDGVCTLAEDLSLKFLPSVNEPRSVVWALDFRPSDPNCFLAGGRDRKFETLVHGLAGRPPPGVTTLVRMADLRALRASVLRVGLPCPVNHLKWVSEYQFVASCLRSNLSLHDVRFAKHDSSRGDRADLSRPLLTFPEHKNDPHIWTGFDVSASLGVCAAAQEDGTVKIFSLRTGKWLRPGKGGIYNASFDKSPQSQLRPEVSYGVEAIWWPRPVRALHFAQMPRERSESLFVGLGWTVTKYSLGLRPEDDENL